MFGVCVQNMRHAILDPQAVCMACNDAAKLNRTDEVLFLAVGRAHLALFSPGVGRKSYARNSWEPHGPMVAPWSHAPRQFVLFSSNSELT